MRPRGQGRQENRPTYAGIDTLRGLSILLVVVHHIAIRLSLQKTPLADLFPARLLHALSYNGFQAVYIFFVISGFLITIHSLSRHGRLVDLALAPFYARRFARIVPLLTLLIAVLSVLHLVGMPNHVIDGEGQSLSRAIVAAFGFHINWYEGQTGYLPGGWDVLWSLSIEEVFYLGFPLVCLLIRSHIALGLVLGVFALTLPWTHGMIVDNQIWREKHYFPGMSAIATGVVTALVAHHVPLTRRWAAGLQIVGGACIIAVLGWSDLVFSSVGVGLLLVLTLGSAMLILGFHGARDAIPWPGLAWLRACGRLSYEIYLSHMFVVFGAVGAFHRLALDTREGWVVYVPVLVLCWGLGLAIERAFSQPANEVLRRRLIPKTASVGASRSS